jgi:prophage regulatory protein
MQVPRVIRLPELMERVAVSRTTVYRWEAEGKLPRRIALGPNSVGWLAEEVDAWISSRVRR